MLTSSLKLPPLVVVIWEWEWEDDITDASNTDENVTPEPENDQMTHVSETSFSGESHQQGENSEDDSDAANCIEVQHTVTFKCIGTTHDFHAQNTLRSVSQLLAKGDVVPVNIYPEPNNCYDSKAIAFKCWLDDDWHRIGYIVKEALDAVHEARDNDEIINVFFKWAKYLVNWTRSGPGYYAGINITKHGQLPTAVCACASTR